MTANNVLPLAILFIIFFIAESIQFFDSDRIINPLEESQVYNNQAFNLISVLNRINSNDPGSFRIAANGNQKLQNTQQDFREYVKSKNNLFDYSKWSTAVPLSTIENFNIKVVTKSKEILNQKFLDLKVTKTIDAESIRKEITEFRNQNQDSNIKNFANIDHNGDQISIQNSVNETHSSILDKINKNKTSINDSFLSDRKQTTTVNEIDSPASKSNQTTTLNYFEQVVNDSNKESDFEWMTYIYLFLIFMLICFAFLIAYCVYNCCKKSKSKISDTHIEKLVVDDPKKEVDTEKKLVDDPKKEVDTEKKLVGEETFKSPDINLSEHIVSNDQKINSNTLIINNKNDDLKKDKVEVPNLDSVKTPDVNLMPQCARCSSTQIIKKCYTETDQHDLDSNFSSVHSISKETASSCSSCSALNNKNFKTSLPKQKPESQQILNRLSSTTRTKQSDNPSSKSTYVRYCKTATAISK